MAGYMAGHGTRRSWREAGPRAAGSKAQPPEQTADPQPQRKCRGKVEQRRAKQRQRPGPTRKDHERAQGRDQSQPGGDRRQRGADRADGKRQQRTQAKSCLDGQQLEPFGDPLATGRQRSAERAAQVFRRFRALTTNGRAVLVICRGPGTGAVIRPGTFTREHRTPPRPWRCSRMPLHECASIDLQGCNQRRVRCASTQPAAKAIPSEVSGRSMMNVRTSSVYC